MRKKKNHYFLFSSLKFVALLNLDNSMILWLSGGDSFKKLDLSWNILNCAGTELFTYFKMEQSFNWLVNFKTALTFHYEPVIAGDKKRGGRGRKTLLLWTTENEKYTSMTWIMNSFLKFQFSKKWALYSIIQRPISILVDHNSHFLIIFHVSFPNRWWR